MTLIVSHIARDYVIQVSDRRVTWKASKGKKDDDTTKGVLFNSNFTFGYAGEAELYRAQAVQAANKTKFELIPTHQWLIEVLCLKWHSLESSLANVYEELRRVLNNLSKMPAHVFIGMGFINRKVEDPVFPVIYEITNINLHDRSIQQKLDLHEYYIPPGEDFLTHYSPCEFPKTIKKRTRRDIQRALDGDCGPRDIAAILARTVREVAACNTLVGRGLLITCLPRQQVERVKAGGDWTYTTKPFNLDNFTFQYLPAEADLENGGISYGPAFCVNGNCTSALSMEDATSKVVVLNPGKQNPPQPSPPLSAEL